MLKAFIALVAVAVFISMVSSVRVVPKKLAQGKEKVGNCWMCMGMYGHDLCSRYG